MTPKTQRRIAFLDHMGLGNLGDAATQDAIIHHVRSRNPEAELCLVSLDPVDSARRHGLLSYAIASSISVEVAEPPQASPQGSSASRSPDAPGGDEGELPARRDAEDEGDAASPGAIRRLKRALQRVPLFDRALGWLWWARREAAFLSRCRERLRDVDTLVISGGGQIDDSWGGPMGAPLNLLRWTGVARTTGTRIVYLCVGAGPLDHRSSRWMTRVALLGARVRTFRDEPSRRFVEKLGVRRNLQVYPDLAHGLPVDEPSRRQEGRSEQLIVGLGPIPYMSPDWWTERDAERYRIYVDTLADFAVWLHEHSHGIRFILGEVFMDGAVTADLRQAIAARLPAAAEAIPPVEIETVADLVSAIQETDVVVSSRFHGVLLSQRLGRPVIAVSYHQKIDTLMQDMGQGDCVLPIDDFGVDQLIAALGRIREHLPELQATLDANARERADRLERLYDEVFTPPGR